MKYLLSVAALANLATSIGFPETELAQIGTECHNNGCCGCWSSCCHNHCHSHCDGHDDHNDDTTGDNNNGEDMDMPPWQTCPPLSCPSLEDDGSVSALLTIASSVDQGWSVFGGNDGCMDYCEFREMWECMSDWGPFGWSGPGSELTAT